MNPSVSVVMPVFNAQQSVLRAVRSVLASRLPGIELVAVDDGSTDGTSALLGSVRDDRLRVIRTAHRGIVGALNVALSEANAPFIARMDADDVCAADRLAGQLGRLKQGDVEIVGSQVRIVDEQGQPVPSMQRYEAWLNSLNEPEVIAAMRFVESPLVHPSVMARREVFDLGYRELAWAEDYDLWLRAFQAGFRAAKITEPTFLWTDSSRRLTRTDLRYSPSAFDACKRHHLLEGPLNHHQQIDLWGAGTTGKPWLRWFLGTKVGVRRLVDISPKRAGQRIHGVPVMAPEQMPWADGIPMVIAVGAAGARPLIQEHLKTRGYRPGVDAWFVA